MTCRAKEVAPSCAAPMDTRWYKEDENEPTEFAFSRRLYKEKENEPTESAVLRGRDPPPSHYLLKIESFSSLSQASVEKYQSDQFDAGGCKWRLFIYPNGDTSKDGGNHISIYLELVETSSFSVGWEVNVVLNFFLLNQLQDKYDSLQDGSVMRYHAMKTKWGIPRFIHLEKFHNPLNGYLIEDACVFGAEVFVVKTTFKAKRLSMIKEIVPCYHRWKVSTCSNLFMSDSFGDYDWTIWFYPGGKNEAKGNSISIFLYPDLSRLPSNSKLFAKYILRIIDQKNGNHFEVEGGENVFDPSTDWGCTKFMSLSKFKDPKQGFVVNDSCKIEAAVTVLGFLRTES